MMKAAASKADIDLPSDDEKGCSCMASKRIDDERLEEMRSNDACTSVVQVGDYT
jgi:hypothetical protein